MVETIKFFEEAYGKRPTVKWSPHKSRQSTIEKRMLRLLKRFKSFFPGLTFFSSHIKILCDLV